MGPSTPYRHFPGNDLIEAVLDDPIQTARENAERAMRIGDPCEAFGVVFTRSCDLSERDIATFVRLAGASQLRQHAVAVRLPSKTSAAAGDGQEVA